MLGVVKKKTIVFPIWSFEPFGHRDPHSAWAPLGPLGPVPGALGALGAPGAPGALGAPGAPGALTPWPIPHKKKVEHLGILT